MESNRQKKINQILQEEMSEIFRRESAKIRKGILISVTEAKVAPDLSSAKVYLSIFPAEHRTLLMKEIHHLNPQIRKMLGMRLAKQLRQIPELKFYLDTTLDDAERIEKALRGEDENPILK
ncbi:MAG: 30S ribosome-binding factor RbfA [Flavobacteriaceae bacterium]|jgi:ribosome-binding factor A|nr:30S ribosome-binding factor RbfA [Flavobacteriaceae bacterium]